MGIHQERRHVRSAPMVRRHSSSTSSRNSAMRSGCGLCLWASWRDFALPSGGHGPGWVQQVIEEKDLADDPELEEARDFVSRIWASKLNGV